MARALIAEANGLTPPYALRAGQRLFIPRTRHHVVARGDTRFTVAYLYAVPWSDIAVANGLELDAALRPGQRLLIPTVLNNRATPAPAAGQQAATPAAPTARFAWPVSANVRRGFSPRGRTNYHDGIDMAVPIGTAVRASAGGKVLFAGDEPRQFGKLVVVDHGGGWHTAYAFLSRITVKVGDDVSPGERVGLSGRTGMARGPEVHFELRHDNAPVDPQGHLPRR